MLIEYKGEVIHQGNIVTFLNDEFKLEKGREKTNQDWSCGHE